MLLNKITAIAVIACSLTLSACALTETTSTTSASLDAATPDITLNRFIDVRLASIRKEAAAGGGENIDALARLMGRNQDSLGPWMQQNYSELFDNLEAPHELVARMEKLSNES